jgi:hypothetical protein
MTQWKTLQVLSAAQTELNKIHHAELDRIKERERVEIEAFQQFRDKLNAATDDYLRSGIAVLSTDLTKHFNRLPDRKPKAYFKELAKELDRPLIFAEESRESRYGPSVKGNWKYTPVVDLTIPATERMKNAVAGLSLLAVPNSRENESAPVVSNHSERTWRFKFRGVEGIAQFTAFREFCRTNRVMRVVLRIPTE